MTSPSGSPGTGTSTPLPGPDPDDEARYREVRGRDAARPGDLATLLAHLDDPSWRVRAAAAGRLALGDPARVVSPLIAALASGGTGRGSAAAGALVLVGAAAVPALVQALGSDAPGLRIAAAEVLGALGERQASVALAHHLGDPDESVRLAAADALASLGGAAALDALERASRSPEARLVRTALDGLVRLRAPVPLARLRELATQRPLRRLALRLAGVSGDPGAVPLLVESLSDPSRGVREAALAGLGELRLTGPERVRAALSSLRLPAPLPGPLAAEGPLHLASEDLAVRAGALLVCGPACPAAHVVLVVQAAEEEALRGLAGEALEQLGTEAVDALRAALPRLLPVSRVVAAKALARGGDEQGFRALLAALGELPGPAREVAVEALGRLGNARAVGPLAAMLEGESAAEVVAALSELGSSPPARAAVLSSARGAQLPLSQGWCRVLGRVGDERDAPALLTSLEGTSPGRAAAAAGLARLAERVPPREVPPAPLVQALMDAQPELRAAAAMALGAFASRAGSFLRGPGWSAVERGLALALGDVDASVRAAAALALGRCGARERAGALSELARDPRALPEVAIAALHALSELSAQRIDVLSEAVRHPDAEVVKEAVRAASRLEGPGAFEVISVAGRHLRWDVRQASAEALRQRPEPEALGAVRELLAVERDGLVAQALASAERELSRRAYAGGGARGEGPR